VWSWFLSRINQSTLHRSPSEFGNFFRHLSPVKCADPAIIGGGLADGGLSPRCPFTHLFLARPAPDIAKRPFQCRKVTKFLFSLQAECAWRRFFSRNKGLGDPPPLEAVEYFDFVPVREYGLIGFTAGILLMIISMPRNRISPQWPCGTAPAIMLIPDGTAVPKYKSTSLKS